MLKRRDSPFGLFARLQVMEIDFALAREEHTVETAECTLNVLEDSPACNGVLFWFRLNFGFDVEPFSTAPDRSHALRAFK